MRNLDKPHHGWENLNNGGEVYGRTQVRGIEDAKREYLNLIKQALAVSMENTPNAYERAKVLMEEAKRLYNDYSLEGEDDYKIKGDGSEIKSLLEGMEDDEHLKR